MSLRRRVAALEAAAFPKCLECGQQQVHRGDLTLVAPMSSGATLNATVALGASELCRTCWVWALSNGRWK